MNIEKVTMLKMLYEGRPTIPEMSEQIGKAYATVHKALQEMVAAGLVSPPRYKGAARDYYITNKGYEYLKENGYVKETHDRG